MEILTDFQLGFNHEYQPEKDILFSIKTCHKISRIPASFRGFADINRETPGKMVASEGKPVIIMDSRSVPDPKILKYVRTTNLTKITPKRCR